VGKTRSTLERIVKGKTSKRVDLTTSGGCRENERGGLVTEANLPQKNGKKAGLVKKGHHAIHTTPQKGEDRKKEKAGDESSKKPKNSCKKLVKKNLNPFIWKKKKGSGNDNSNLRTIRFTGGKQCAAGNGKKKKIGSRLTKARGQSIDPVEKGCISHSRRRRGVHCGCPGKREKRARVKTAFKKS